MSDTSKSNKIKAKDWKAIDDLKIQVLGCESGISITNDILSMPDNVDPVIKKAVKDLPKQLQEEIIKKTKSKEWKAKDDLKVSVLHNIEVTESVKILTNDLKETKQHDSESENKDE